MSLSFSHAVESILTSATSFSQLLHSWWPKKRVKNRRETRRRLKERRWHLQGAVKPIPTIRERTLTLPLPEDDSHDRKGNTKSSKSQTTHNQSQSNFFRKLPPEIRLQIYSHAFGDGKTSIIKDSRRRYVAWKPQARSMLPLLLTCRRVYSEAIDLLYSEPEFFFNDFDTICLFSVSILPSRLDLIQRLSLEWDCVCFWVPDLHVPPPFDEFTWKKVWEILGSMKGLRELRVRIWNGPEMSRVVEREVFAPLNQVTTPKVFELELPWKAVDKAHELVHVDAPFKITRVKRDYLRQL